jgi:CBS domain-containing protein
MAHAGHYRKKVITLPAGASVNEAAERMRSEAVGCVVVVADGDRPIGVVTDRDLTVRVIAEAREAGVTPVSAIMSHPPITADPEDPLEKVIERMRGHGVRRVPIVAEGRVIGIVTVDDLLVALGDEIDHLRRAVRAEVMGAQRLAAAEDLGREVMDAVRTLAERAERLGAAARDTALRELETARKRIRKLLG